MFSNNLKSNFMYKNVYFIDTLLTSTYLLNIIKKINLVLLLFIKAAHGIHTFRNALYESQKKFLGPFVSKHLIGCSSCLFVASSLIALSHGQILYLQILPLVSSFKPRWVYCAIDHATQLNHNNHWIGQMCFTVMLIN